MGKLEGKVALITGSDSGIGQATAIEFTREGADVVITYHSNREGAEQTLREVEKPGEKVLSFRWIPARKRKWSGCLTGYWKNSEHWIFWSIMQLLSRQELM